MLSYPFKIFFSVPPSADDFSSRILTVLRFPPSTLCECVRHFSTTMLDTFHRACMLTLESHSKTSTRTLTPRETRPANLHVYSTGQPELAALKRRIPLYNGSIWEPVYACQTPSPSTVSHPIWIREGGFCWWKRLQTWGCILKPPDW